MNPLTNMKNQQKMNERELSLGLTGTSSSWHSQYDDSAWVFVGGLPYDLTEGDVICIFSQCGEIVNVNLVRDKDTGKSKGFAFICYEDQRSTILAVDNLNGAKVLNRAIRVDHKHNYQVPKERGDEDDLTKALREKGCAPPVLHELLGNEYADESGEQKSEKKKKKKMKKEKKKKTKKIRSPDSADVVERPDPRHQGDGRRDDSRRTVDSSSPQMSNCMRSDRSRDVKNEYRPEEQRIKRERRHSSSDSDSLRNKMCKTESSVRRTRSPDSNLDQRKPVVKREFVHSDSARRSDARSDDVERRHSSQNWRKERRDRSVGLDEVVSESRAHYDNTDGRNPPSRAHYDNTDGRNPPSRARYDNTDGRNPPSRARYDNTDGRNPSSRARYDNTDGRNPRDESMNARHTRKVECHTEDVREHADRRRGGSSDRRRDEEVEGKQRRSGDDRTEHRRGRDDEASERRRNRDYEDDVRQRSNDRRETANRHCRDDSEDRKRR